MSERDPDCPFCAVVAGERAADIVYHGPEAVAFLDKRPLFPGHLLVMPHAHHRTLGDIPARELALLMTVVQASSRAMQSGLGADGSFVANNNNVSQSVPHVHFHVVPRKFHDGLRHFFWPRVNYDDDAHRGQVAEALSVAIASELAGKGGAVQP